MGNAGRPKLFKVSKEEFREIWLESLVDEEGKKVSWRKLIRNKEFQDKTGYYRETANGQRKSVSIGSAAYWLAEFKLYDEVLYKYHRDVTNRIDINKTYEEWKSENLQHMNEDNIRLDLMDDKLVRKALTLIATKVNFCKPKCNEYDNIFIFFDSLSYERTFRSKEKLTKTFKRVYNNLLKKEKVTFDDNEV